MEYFKSDDQIALETILDPLVTNKILKNFKTVSSLNSTSKHKYIGLYISFVEFLVLKVCSPKYVPVQTSQALEIATLDYSVFHDFGQQKRGYYEHEVIGGRESCRKRSGR